MIKVIFGELQFLGMVLGDKSSLQKSLDLCNDFWRSISDLARAKSLAIEWNTRKKNIQNNIDQAVRSNPVKPEKKKLVDGSVANISRTLGVIDIQVQELLARIEEPGQWRSFSVDQVVDRLKQVLDSIALNSRGRYGIGYDPDNIRDNEYLVIIDVHCPFRRSRFQHKTIGNQGRWIRPNESGPCLPETWWSDVDRIRIGNRQSNHDRHSKTFNASGIVDLLLTLLHHSLMDYYNHIMRPALALLSR